MNNLVCKEVLSDQLIQRKNEMKNEKERSIFAQIIYGNNYFKKFGVSQRARKIVSFYFQKKI